MRNILMNVPDNAKNEFAGQINAVVKTPNEKEARIEAFLSPIFYYPDV